MNDIILVTADALRADHVSYFDSDSPASTPTLNRLAEGGNAFHSAMANGTHTIVSAPALLTGEYRPGITPSTPTLAETLKNQGYKTAAFSTNVHIRGPQLSHLNLERGFDNFDMCMDAVEEKTRLNTKRVGFELARKVQGVFGLESRPYQWAASAVSYFPRPLVQPVPHAETVNERVASWVETKVSEDEPYFIWIFYLDTHEPFMPPEEWQPDDYTGRYQQWKIDGANRKYRYFKPAMTEDELSVLHDLYTSSVEYWDAQLGHLVEELQELRTEDPTVIVSSDHGELFGTHGSVGHPAAHWEELIHVPLIINGPDIDDEDMHEIVQNIDISSTIAEFAGADTPDSFQGIPLLSEEPMERNGVTTIVDKDPFVISHRTESWKLVKSGEKYWLYDMENDPDGTDLSDEHPDIVDDLSEVATAQISHLSSDYQSTDLEVDQEIEERLRDLGYMRE